MLANKALANRLAKPRMLDARWSSKTMLIPSNGNASAPPLLGVVLARNAYREKTREGLAMAVTKRPAKKPAKPAPPLTWKDQGVEAPDDADLAALQKRYGPPQPRDPLPGQPALLPEVQA